MIIQLKPEPYCPICGAKMMLRTPRVNYSSASEPWQPFWGCNRYPECKGTRKISEDGKPEEDDKWERD